MKKRSLRKSLIGTKIGNLSILDRDNSYNGHGVKYLCKCDCGIGVSVFSSNLVKGATVSCGCFLSKSASERAKKHGHSIPNNISTEYRAWRAMKQRVNSDSYHAKAKYINIKICERWGNSFEFFLLDMGPKPTTSHSLDRYPNRNGNYEPGNCRWATTIEQQNNKDGLRYITYSGISKTLSSWAYLFGITPSTLSEHLGNKSMEQVVSFLMKKEGVYI